MTTTLHEHLFDVNYLLAANYRRGPVRTADFAYELPEQAIAQTPIEPRDSARLLRTSDLTDHRFRDLADLLHPGDLVVVNDTRVRAARLRGKRTPGGGAVELLLLARRPDATWEALARPARKLRVGTRLDLNGLAAEVVAERGEGVVHVRLEAEGDLEVAIDSAGEMPLPPYITTPLDRPDRYQTVYAHTTGSAAAPTAGLHFTPEVLSALGRRGIDLARLELRVGLGTFRPITVEQVEDHVMHEETYVLEEATIRAITKTRAGGGNVVAVGTTTVRALEAAWLNGEPAAGEARTDLFITPGFRFRVVDRLITNFHLPRSSLVCLVAAFMGGAWRDAYVAALTRGYRFLSFGDAMLADREEA